MRWLDRNISAKTLKQPLLSNQRINLYQVQLETLTTEVAHRSEHPPFGENFNFFFNKLN